MKRNNDLSDMFEPTFRQGEPTWHCDVTMALMILGFCIFFGAIIITIAF